MEWTLSSVWPAIKGCAKNHRTADASSNHAMESDRETTARVFTELEYSPKKDENRRLGPPASRGGEG